MKEDLICEILSETINQRREVLLEPLEVLRLLESRDYDSSQSEDFLD